MNDIFDFFGNLFGTEAWPARWHCGESASFHGNEVLRQLTLYWLRVNLSPPVAEVP